ncbi:hypothetical protein N7499_011783 [Penicillium canescens]|uniref:Uncharacterized protein n=1 Tax=Penicillium canescens TaxID=5083 RepID=A0AAD6IKV5_PENCN|nr:uncharacterized protein N7446_007045 [Penicillium canescens]KAJ6049630.1 hypothetical protein N7444_006346 [Penicillium canescens]KAJ6052402.1 hypothetical protein N7460_002936 [Penicillium canescens]KAJ6062925.1 hypothetical protein N7446_007045 [Penicillium canescens]KAJ6069896.1 hypothetical protein N7499_011783 [Penicillium canescens]KAJ6182053.1 hypothetical protein N7485_000695 [Penicillium canescens]
MTWKTARLHVERGEREESGQTEVTIIDEASEESDGSNLGRCQNLNHQDVHMASSIDVASICPQLSKNSRTRLFCFFARDNNYM